MKDYFAKTIPRIEKEVKDFFPKEVNDSWLEDNIGKLLYPFDARVWQPVLSEPFYDLFDRGGKRIRPVLACLTHKGLGGSHPNIYALSIISEMIHSATLMVDDVEDGSSLRRGKAAVHKLYGQNTAINNGNFNYFFPQLLIAEAGLDDHQKVQLYEAIIQEMTRLHIGQGMDLWWSQEGTFDIALNDYLQMSAYKTGALLSIAVKIGGILADADNKTLNKLSEIITSIGIAFQIQDDILNLKPGEEWGKETGEDITEGKVTYMVVDTLSRASDKHKARLIQILKAKTADKDKIQEAILIMDEYEAFNRAHDFSRQLVAKAQEDIQGIIREEEAKRIFLEIFEYIIDRKK
jgi:geranylgeranyl pyrophosphate synthase